MSVPTGSRAGATAERCANSAEAASDRVVSGGSLVLGQELGTGSGGADTVVLSGCNWVTVEPLKGGAGGTVHCEGAVLGDAAVPPAVI
jgi:hypothetical protein